LHEFPVFRAGNDDFEGIPGSPIAFWLSHTSYSLFRTLDPLSDYADLKVGLQTGDNPRFLRFWYEVARSNTSWSGQGNERWIPYSKGGEYRRWYGNAISVLAWGNGGEELREFRDDAGKKKAYLRNTSYYFQEGVEWSDVGQSVLGARYRPPHQIFDVVSMSLFQKPHSSVSLAEVLAFLNTSMASKFLNALAPGMHYNTGYVGNLPFRPLANPEVARSISDKAVGIARTDWDSFETSWDFKVLPLLRQGTKGTTIEACWEAWRAQCADAISRMRGLETDNNRLFIDAYGLTDELKPEVSEDQITLARADARRDMAAFLSYFVGCMMGRYSLDAPGLIIADPAHTLEQFFSKVGKPANQLAFVPSEHGIIPVLDGEWFEGDIVARAHNFLRAVFGEATFEANLGFIDESLGKDLRKYFITDFYKNHLQTYRRRPIYWLFSSGKERAFQALVYLHRYHDGTLPRMRTEYVIPLQGKIASRIDQLADDIQKAASTSHRKTMEKERDKLLLQRTELQAFDEKLRHFADQRIQIDLDDGVKVNYGKFGDLLAEVKAVTGGSD
jgi:hypothetical protein